MNGCNCLVTGGSGFLGKHLVARLQDTGRSVVSLGKDDVPGQGVIVADLAVPNIDLSAAGVEFEEVYHLAGMAHIVPRTQAEKQLFFSVNVTGTLNLLRALERTGRLPDKILFVSTVAVYGVEEGWMLDENSQCTATDPYGLSKRQAEDLLVEWCSRNSVRWGIVRLPLVAGRNPPGNLGAMIHAMAGGWYFGVGPGTARRSIVLAKDICQILPLVAASEGVFHLTDGSHPTMAELEKALAGALQRRTPLRLPMWIAQAGAGLGDWCQRMTGKSMPFSSRLLKKLTNTLTFSDERARTVLGWKPSRVLDHLADLLG